MLTFAGKGCAGQPQSDLWLQAETEELCLRFGFLPHGECLFSLLIVCCRWQTFTVIAVNVAIVGNISYNCFNRREHLFEGEPWKH